MSRRREVIFREPYQVGDDMEKEIAWIVDYFKQFEGKRRSEGVR